MSYKPAMYVYKIKTIGNTTQVPSTSWAQINGTMDEIKSFLFNSSEGDEFEIKVKKMSWEEFEQLPEFRGY